MTKTHYLALAILVLAASPAAALEVESTATMPGKPAQLWKRIGSFCSIKDWHPMIAKCEK